MRSAAPPARGTVRAAKLFGQTVSAGGVTVGADVASGEFNPWQTTKDAAFSMIGTYGATRIAGIPRGADVKSFSSPLFFNGAQMSNASRCSGITRHTVDTCVTCVGSAGIIGFAAVAAIKF
jgi:hypothetical protein